MEYTEARKAVTPAKNCVVLMPDGRYETCGSSFPPRGFHSWRYTLGEWNRVANIVRLKEGIEEVWEAHKDKTMSYYQTYDPVMSRYDKHRLEDDEVLAYLKEFQGCWMNLSPQDEHKKNGQAWIRENYREGLIYIALPKTLLWEIMSDHEIY